MIPSKPTNTPINVYLIDFNVQERINVSISDSKNINHLKMIKAKPYEDPKHPYTPKVYKPHQQRFTIPLCSITSQSETDLL